MAYRGKFTGGKNGGWVNLISEDASLASTPLLIQNRSADEELYVVFGGAQPSSRGDGFLLMENQVLAGSGAAIWVRGTGGFNLVIQDKE